MKALTVPVTVQIRRGRLLGLIAAVAVLAAAVTWALSTYAVGTDGKTAQTVSPTTAVAQPAVTPHSVPTSGGQKSPIMSMTPAELQAGAFGGYALPTYTSDSTLEEVLASMSPATRSYTEKIMGLTIEQLQAGAAGSP